MMSLGLVDAQGVEEVILKRQQVQEQPIQVPSQQASGGTGDSVEDKVVGGGNDGSEDDSGVNHANEPNSYPPPAEIPCLSQGHSGNSQADQEGVSKM